MSETAILRAMIAMARADNDFSDVERGHIKRIYADIAGKELSEERLSAEIAARENGEYTTIAYLRKHRAELTVEAREALIKAAYRILICDDEVAGEERKKLAEIAAAIGLEEIHYKAVLEDVTDR